MLIAAVPIVSESAADMLDEDNPNVAVETTTVRVTALPASAAVSIPVASIDPDEVKNTMEPTWPAELEEHVEHRGVTESLTVYEVNRVVNTEFVNESTV